MAGNEPLNGDESNNQQELERLPETKEAAKDPHVEELMLLPSQLSIRSTKFLKNPIWQNMSTAAVAIFTLALVITSLLQWKATQDSINAARKSADAAIDMVNLAHEANQITRESSLINVRPWVGWKAKAANVETGHKPTIIFELVNHGNSPAVSVTFQIDIFYQDGDVSVKKYLDAIDNSKLKSVHTLFPNQVLIDKFDSPKILTLEDMEDLSSGTRKLVGLGKISYEDISGKEHHTWIATEYNPRLKLMTGTIPPDLPKDD